MGGSAGEPAGKRQATIVDVAAAANVAIGTVSRYLNGLDVRRSNREQIERAIVELGYRRNALAMAMKTETTRVVGLLVPAFDEFHAQVLEHLARSVRLSERAMLTYCHSNEPRIFRDAVDFFSAQRVDALVVEGSHIAEGLLEEVARQGVPLIFYNDTVSGPPADSVLVENKKASHRAVSHLIDLGHRRIAAIRGNLSDSSARLRLEGYEAAMREHGLAIDPRYAGPGDWGPERGYSAIKALMALDEPPTAVFTSNYQIAFGVLTWIKEQGLRVPEDLSLISFDDVALFRLYGTGITAIAQPVARIADSIAELLIMRLSRPVDSKVHTLILDCDLILRGSTRRLH